MFFYISADLGKVYINFFFYAILFAS